MKEMPQQENFDLIFVMDRSGSMSGSETDTIGGFNSFIQKELKKESNTRVTTVLFDDHYEMLYKRKPICDVKELTDKEYWVRGCTALLDAIGKTINTLDKEIDNKVLFVIMTDGLENASREYSYKRIKDMIELQKKCGWDFIFQAANIDTEYEAERLGINKDMAMSFKANSKGVSDSLKYCCCMISGARKKPRKK